MQHPQIVDAHKFLQCRVISVVLSSCHAGLPIARPCAAMRHQSRSASWTYLPSDAVSLYVFAQVAALLTLQPQQQQQPLPQPVPMAIGSTSADVDDDEFLDPITYDIIVDPVIGNDGCTYNRTTAYDLMTKGSVMPGCREPFKLGADNVHFRSRLRRAHPHTEQLMRQETEDSPQVQSDFASYFRVCLTD